MKGTVYRIKDDDKSYNTKCKEYKMTKGKHDLLLRIVKTLGAIMITVPFALCWYLYYGKDVVSPFYAKGNFMMIALFFVLFIVFGRVYGAFLMSMHRISEIVYAQFLAAGATDLIMYIVICLLSKGFPNLLPGVAALVCDNNGGCFFDIFF